MRVTIVGTGNMARAIARRALAGGHHVTFVGTVVNKADELVDEFRGEGPVAADETVGGDIVVLAVPYTQAPHVVRQHANRLDGMVVVDITNPVDLGALEPLDRAFIAPFDSAAQVIADAAPDGARVVKAFNTTFAGPLTAGAVAGRPLDVFIAGDDADAKERSRSWPATADCARSTPERSPGAQLESLGYFHMAIQGSLGTAFASAVAVVP